MMVSIGKKQIVSRWAVGVAWVTLALTVGFLASVAAVSAEEWSNPTAPGILVFEVNVSYNDGSDETQSVRTEAKVVVTQVRAWELAHDPFTVVYRQPGHETEFYATLYNLGNGEDTFEIGFEWLFEWLDSREWVNEKLPNGWSVALDPPGPVTLAAGESRQLKVIVSAGTEVRDGDALAVRLKVVAPERQPEVEGAEGLSELPVLPEQSKETEPMEVRIVDQVAVFVLKPQNGSGEARPRETLRFDGLIRNPSWAKIPSVENTSVKATIEIPDDFIIEGYQVDNDSVSNYACSIDVGSHANEIVVTCNDPIPGTEDSEGPGEVQFFLLLSVKPYTPPTDGDTKYFLSGSVTYEDITGGFHVVVASDEGDKIPEVIVLSQRLVRIYPVANGGPSDSDLEFHLDGTPGETLSRHFWVKNEGNVDDTYEIKLVTEPEVFTWTIQCADGLDVGTLSPAAEQECTVTVQIPGGAKDGTRDEVSLQAVTLDLPDAYYSNGLTLKLDVSAPDVKAQIVVATDMDFNVPATQVKPGDTVYVKIVVENTGRDDATEFQLQHDIPDALTDVQIVSVELIPGDPTIPDPTIPDPTLSGNKLTMGPTLLPSGATLTIIYQGVVK